MCVFFLLSCLTLFNLLRLNGFDESVIKGEEMLIPIYDCSSNYSKHQNNLEEADPRHLEETGYMLGLSKSTCNSQ